MTQTTALKLGEQIRTGKISAAEAVRLSLDQIQRQEPQIRAFLNVTEEYALKRAAEVEEGIAHGRYTGPLAGVPLAVKDNFCVEGIETTCASKILKGFVPSYTAQAVKNLEDAGMIVIGKTNMDEFAMGSTSETSAFGVTHNPWDTSRVPGGSSGGSCAAVAAGEVTAALGSDTGGSIRQPSAFCGVTGIKPTYGTISRYGLVAYASSLDQAGPIGRDVSDCAAMLEALSGQDPKDSTSLNRKDLDFRRYLREDVRGMRFGIPKEYLTEGLDQEICDTLKEMETELRKAGAIVEYFSLDLVEYVIPAYYVIACAEASSNLERFDGVKYGYRASDYEGLHQMYKRTRTEGFGEEVKRRIMLGSFVLSSGYYDAYYLKALKVRRLIQEAFLRAFQNYDIILAPAAPQTAPKIGESLQDPMKMYLSDIYTAAVNLAGIPGISLPCRVDSRGLPVGIQMLAGHFQEGKLLQAAYTYEKIRGEWKLPQGQEV